MPLTPEEERELQQLISELTPEERAGLEAQLTGQASQAGPDLAEGEVAQPMSDPLGAPGMPGERAEAALTGFGETASMGYLPRIQAAAQTKVVDPIAKFLGVGPFRDQAELEEAGIEHPGSPDYIEARDQFSRQADRSREADPIGSLIGSGAGIAASMAVPGGAARTIPGAIGRGAGIGAAYDPGAEEGEAAGLQLGERARGAALGAGASGIGAGIARPIQTAARREGQIDAMKRGQVPKQMRQTLDESRQRLGQQYIQPRRDQLREIVKPHKVEVSPQILKGIGAAGRFGPTGRARGGLRPYAERLEQRRAPDQATVPIRGERAVDLRTALGREAGYRPVTAATQRAEATHQRAEQARNILSRKIKDVDPRVGPLDSEISNAMRLSDVMGKIRHPQQFFRRAGDPRNPEHAIVAELDDMIKTGLQSQSVDVRRASELLLDWRRYFRPLEAPMEFRRGVQRAAGRASQITEPATRARPTEVGTRSLLEDVRRERVREDE